MSNQSEDKMSDKDKTMFDPTYDVSVEIVKDQPVLTYGEGDEPFDVLTFQHILRTLDCAENYVWMDHDKDPTTEQQQYLDVFRALSSLVMQIGNAVTDDVSKVRSESMIDCGLR